MTRRQFVLSVTVFFAASLTSQLQASTLSFSFAGPGVSGAVQLTYGTAADATSSDTYGVTGISGTFSDLNGGLDLVNMPIGSLIGVRHDTPDATSYPLHGGLLNIYGLMFNIGRGRVVEIWSNADLSGTSSDRVDSAAAAGASNTALYYFGTGLSTIPEPGAIGSVGVGLLGMLVRRRARA